MSSSTDRRSVLKTGAAAAIAATLGGAVRSPGSAYGATAPIVAEAATPADTPLTVKGAAGQYANLTEWQDSSGTVRTSVDKAGAITTRHINLDTAAYGESVSPEIHFKAANGMWINGIDWAGTPPARDYIVAAKAKFPLESQVTDTIAVAHRGDLWPTVKLGISSVDDNTAFTTFTPWADDDGNAREPGMAGLLVRHPHGATAPAIAVRNWMSDHNAFGVMLDGSVELKNPASGLRSLRLDASSGELSAGWDGKTPVTVTNGLTVRGYPGAGNWVGLVRFRQDTDTGDRLMIRSDGSIFWGTGSGSVDPGTQLARNGAGVLRAEGKLVAKNGLGAGNTVAASKLGTLTRKMEVFDADGKSIGFVPIYSSIS